MKRMTIVAAAGAVACLAAVPAAASQAATLRPAAASAAPTFSTGQAARQAASASGVAGFKPVTANLAIENPQVPRALTKTKSPNGPNPAAAATGAGAPTVAAGPAARGRGSVVNAFDGLNDLTNDQLFGADTPPDQGLCVGPDHTIKGVPDAVWEVVNEVGQETTTNGTILTGPLNLPTLFQDQMAFSDPRCLFDPSTKSFYFTIDQLPRERAEPSSPGEHGQRRPGDQLPRRGDLPVRLLAQRAVPRRPAEDRVRQQRAHHLHGRVLRPQPGGTGRYHPGHLEVATGERGQPRSTSPPRGLLSLAGNPIVGLDPAINTGTPTAYLVNSVPFLPDGSNNPVGNTLGLWTLGDTASVTTENGTPTLTSKVLRSEPYAFPVPAPSTGSGAVVNTITIPPNSFPITSEAALNPDDSRLSGPVNVTPGPFGTLNLWTALDAAVIPSTGTATRDGAAWFEVNTGIGRVINQGFVAASGSASLLYPAVQPCGQQDGDGLHDHQPDR